MDTAFEPIELLRRRAMVGKTLQYGNYEFILKHEYVKYICADNEKVFLAEDVDKKQYIIKAFQYKHTSKKVCSDIDNEIEILEHLATSGLDDYKVVCTWIDDDGQNYQRFFVMNYIDGEILKNYCDIENVDCLVMLIKSMINGLKQLHQLGIIHGDTHSGNIIWTGATIKYIDFGLGEFINKLSPCGKEKSLLEDYYYLLSTIYDFCIGIFDNNKELLLKFPDDVKKYQTILNVINNDLERNCLTLESAEKYFCSLINYQ